MRKDKIIVDASGYLLATILTQFITLIAGILTRRFLGPLQMGVWTLLQMILTYSTYTSIGVMDAVGREIPFCLGKGDNERSDKIKNLGFSFSMTVTVITMLGILVYAFWYRAHLQKEIFYGLLFISVILFLQKLSDLYIAFLRSYQFFAIASKQMIWSAIVNGLLVAILSWRFRIFGFMWAMCISFIFNILYMVSRKQFYFKFYLNRAQLWSLIQYGLPLMIIGLFGTFFFND